MKHKILFGILATILLLIPGVLGNVSMRANFYNPSDFTFGTGTYTTAFTQEYYSPNPKTTTFTVLSTTVKKLSGTSTNVVYVNVSQNDSVDWNERKLRTVSDIGTAGNTGAGILFGHSPKGDNTLTFDVKRDGGGNVQLHDFGMVIGQAQSNDTEFNATLITLDANFSDDEYTVIQTFNLTTQTAGDAIMMGFIYNNFTGGEDEVSYYVENTDTSEESSYSLRSASSTNSVGSMGIAWVFEGLGVGVNNFALYAKSDEESTNWAQGNIVLVSLADNESNEVSWIRNSGAGDDDDYTTIDPGTPTTILSTNHTMSNGTAMYVYYHVSMENRGVGGRFARVNITMNGSAECNFDQDRSFSENKEIGAITIATVCTGLSVGSRYSINITLDHNMTSATRVYDDTVVGMEVFTFPLAPTEPTLPQGCGEGVEYDGNVFNISLDNGFYFGHDYCAGNFYKNGGTIYRSGGQVTWYNGSDGDYTGTYHHKNISCNGGGVISCCQIKDDQGVAFLDICQNASITSNGGLQLDRSMKMFNTDWQYENFTMESEQRAFWTNTTDWYYIPSQGWVHTDVATWVHFPLFTSAFFPAYIAVNLSYPSYMVAGTNATHATHRYGNTNNWYFATQTPKGSFAKMTEYEQSFYYYIDDLELTSNNSRNDMNKLDFGKYIEWFTHGWPETNFSFTDGMTTFSHWSNSDSSIQGAANELGYSPYLCKFPCLFGQHEYVYESEPPETWDWKRGKVGRYDQYEPLWNEWYAATNDDSVLIRDAGYLTENSTGMTSMKVNIGHTNTSEFWYNYTLNKSEFNYLPNISWSYWANGTVFGYDLESFDGNKSLIYGGTGLYSYKTAYSDEININPGDILNCSCTAKVLTSSAVNSLICRYIFYNSSVENWDWFDGSQIGTSTTANWIQHNFSYAIPENATNWTKARIYLIAGTDANTILLDNCNTSKNGVPFGDNLDFEDAYHSYVEETNFILLDNFLDRLYDYTLSAQNLQMRPFDGNLRIIDRLKENGIIVGTNQWTQRIHAYKYLDFGHLESMSSEYGAGRSYAYAAARYDNQYDLFINAQYFPSLPILEIFSEVVDVDTNSSNYDIIAGIMTAQAKVHDLTANFDWSDSANEDFNVNSSKIIVRLHKNMETSPRIHSTCMWVNDSNGLIPLGHDIEVNISYTPCTIETNAEYYQLDDSNVTQVTGGMITLDGMDAESMHNLKVWDSTFRVTSKAGINFLYSRKSGRDVLMQTISTQSYPYGSGGVNATITYEGTHHILDTDMNAILCYGSPCSFDITHTRNLTARYYSSTPGLDSCVASMSSLGARLGTLASIIVLIAMLAIAYYGFIKQELSFVQTLTGLLIGFTMIFIIGLIISMGLVACGAN